jgi:hypothetical protein
MSVLNRKSNVSIAEQFFTEEQEQEEIEEYKPQHPAIAFIKQVSIESNKVDHLEDYVEVTPFEKN